MSPEPSPLPSLVVVATPEEAAHVPPGLPLLVTGVGKVAAAAAVAAQLARHPGAYREVLNVGTAGALRNGVNGLHVPSVVLNHDISAQALAAIGYQVPDRLEVEGGDGSVLATGDTFVTTPEARAALARRAHLVDMEGFAVAWACRQAGVACRLVKHVSDNADASALSWPEVVEASALVLGRWLSARTGAPLS